MVGECVGGVLAVGDFSPTTIVKMGVGKFMGNDVARKLVRALFESRLENNAATCSGGAE